MNKMSTLGLVLRWYGLEFGSGMTALILSALGLMNFKPDPPGIAYQSLADMLGIWPYVLGMAVGAFTAGRAWRRASAFRKGD